MCVCVCVCVWNHKLRATANVNEIFYKSNSVKMLLDNKLLSTLICKLVVVFWIENCFLNVTEMTMKS